MSNFDPATNTIVAATRRLDRRPRTGRSRPQQLRAAPRLRVPGIARHGRARWLRLGYIHFNRLASAGLLATNFPVVTRATVTQSTTQTVGGVSQPVPLCTGDQFSGCFRTTQQGYAPNLPNNVVLHIPRDTPAGNDRRAITCRCSTQFTPSLIVDLGYVGNQARDLAMLADINQARPPLPGENANATLAARTADPGLRHHFCRPARGVLELQLPAGQGRVPHVGSSLNLLNSFTWSKAIDNVCAGARGSERQHRYAAERVRHRQ